MEVTFLFFLLHLYMRKGDWGMCPNYKGITLLNLPGNVYAGALDWRIHLLVEPQIE